VSFDDESTPVYSGRRFPKVERRRGKRPRSVFRTYRPWRRRMGILLYVAAFAVAGSALVATVSDIANDPMSPSPGEPQAPHTDQPVAEPREDLHPH
jgi:hypothetical protein